MKSTILSASIVLLLGATSFIKPNHEPKDFGTLKTSKQCFNIGDTVMITRQYSTFIISKYRGQDEFRYYGYLYIVK